MPSEPTPTPPENNEASRESRDEADDLCKQVQDSSEQKSRAEARGGMDDLIDSQSARMKDLKALRPSGISHYGFGNPFRENPELQAEAERQNEAIRGSELDGIDGKFHSVLEGIRGEIQEISSIKDDHERASQSGTEQKMFTDQASQNVSADFQSPSIDPIDTDGWQASFDGTPQYQAEQIIVAEAPTDVSSLASDAPKLVETREERKARLLEELQANPVVGDKPAATASATPRNEVIAVLRGPGPAPERGAGQAETDLPKPKPVQPPKIEPAHPSPQLHNDSAPIFKPQPTLPKQYDASPPKPPAPILQPGTPHSQPMLPKPNGPITPTNDSRPPNPQNSTSSDGPIFKHQPIVPKPNDVVMPKPTTTGAPASDMHVPIPVPVPKIQPMPTERLSQPVPPSELKNIGSEVRNDAASLLKMQIENMKLEQQAGKDLRNAHEELNTVARAAIKDPAALKQFLEDMNTFEQRFMNESCRDHRHEKMDEVKRSFEQINKLLSADHDALENQLPANLKDKPWRQLVAEQFMRHAAEPTSVDQGKRAVCPTAALQAREYVREPACVARMLTDVVLIGKYYSTLGGKEVNVASCPSNFLPDWEAQRYNIKTKMEGYTQEGTGKHLEDSSRSYASQLYDVVATNLILNGKGWAYEQASEPAGVPRKEQERQKTDAYVVNLNNPMDRRTWEQAMHIAPQPISVTCADLVRLNDYVTGKRERGFIVEPSTLSSRAAVQYETRKAFDFANFVSGTSFIHQNSDFVPILRAIEGAGQWPPIMRVNTTEAPFKKTDGGEHFILGKSLSPDGKSCEFDNFWGKDDDHLGSRSVDSSVLAEAVNSSTLSNLEYEGQLMDNWKKTKAFNWEDRRKKFQDVSRWAEQNVSLSMKQHDVEQQLKNSQFNDQKLHDWITKKPYDKHFKEWDRLYREWLRKYPEEEVEKK